MSLLATASSPSNSRYFTVSLSPNRSALPGVILITLTSQHTEELRVNISSIRIKKFGDEAFQEVDDFRILAGASADKHFRIDLDPYEARDYGILIDCQRSFDFELTAKDQRLQSQFVLMGRINGCDPSINVDTTNATPVTTNTHFHPGQIVVFNTDVMDPSLRPLAEWEYVVEEEDGSPNDFGIFEANRINTPAAYLDIGESGYRSLQGKYEEYLEWNRDTVAMPLDDLVAVHIRNISNRQHGWIFRLNLFILAEK